MDAELDGARLWWIASGLLLALELFSGTVFLLLLAIGLACAGLVAWGGGAVTLQMLTAALISSSAAPSRSCPSRAPGWSSAWASTTARSRPA